MTAPHRFAAPLLAALALAGCVAHEAAGDKAAATGDWKRAVADYRRALQQDPNTPGVADKLRAAEESAVRQSLERAQACQAQHDFPCAVGEADYVLAMRPGDPEAQLLRVSAGRDLALQYVETIVPAARAGDFAGAGSRYDDARKLSREAEVMQRSDAAIAEVVRLARAESNRLRAARDFDGAIEVLAPVVRFDGSLRAEQDAIEADRAQWIGAEYERLAQAGDAAMSSRAWSEATNRYQAAEALRPNGRAVQPLSYVRAMSSGEAAIARRDWAEADRAFRFAASTGLDRGGVAMAELSKVELRTYRVSLRELLVRPLRFNGAPWAGYQSPLLNQLLAFVTASVNQGPVPPAVIAALQRVPPQNLPDLVVQVRLPDGQLLATAPARALHVGYDAEFTVRTNAYDDGRIGVWVRHVGAGPEEVAAFEMPVRDVVSGAAASLRSQGVLQMSWTVVQDERAAPGFVRGWFDGQVPVVVTPPPAGPPTYPGQPPTYPGEPPQYPGGPRWRLEVREIEARVSMRDAREDRRNDIPDAVVDVLVNGQLAIRTEVARNDWTPRWRLAATFLELAPGDTVDVVLHDVDRRDSDVLGSTRFVIGDRPPRTFDLRTARDSTVRVELR